MTYSTYWNQLSPKDRVRSFFDDTLSEADEYITDGELTAGELIEAFVESVISSQKYFADKVKVYDAIIDAITSRSGKQ